jgi:hypothetical protein
MYPADIIRTIARATWSGCSSLGASGLNEAISGHIQLHVWDFVSPVPSRKSAISVATRL